MWSSFIQPHQLYKNSVRCISPAQQEPWLGIEHQFERTAANSWSSFSLLVLHWIRHYPTNTTWSRLLQSWRAETISSPNQIGRFFIGCKCCHSPFFCVSPLLFNRWVLLSSMVQVITYRPSRRAAQQHHASHHRNTAPYTVGMAASSRQYCTC